MQQASRNVSKKINKESQGLLSLCGLTARLFSINIDVQNVQFLNYYRYTKCQTDSVGHEQVILFNGIY